MLAFAFVLFGEGSLSAWRDGLESGSCGSNAGSNVAAQRSNSLQSKKDLAIRNLVSSFCSSRASRGSMGNCELSQGFRLGIASVGESGSVSEPYDKSVEASGNEFSSSAALQ